MAGLQPGRNTSRCVALCVLSTVVICSVINYSFRFASKTLFATVELENRDSGYDEPQLDVAYWRSVASPLRYEFVGSQPLFPPCNKSLPPGLPHWGEHPYLGPFPYINESKNPCWHDGENILCVPYFYLAGVSKSGTSDLFFLIEKHPDLVPTRKEQHWFDRRRYNAKRSFLDYTNRFKNLAALVKSEIQHGKVCKKIVGDASPSYFYDSYQWQQYSGNENCTEPRVILPNHIRQLTPNAKVILIIRHPVQRLYSRYLFDMRHASPKEVSREAFHWKVVDGLTKYEDCIQRWSLRHCVYNKTLAEDVHRLRIAENMYPVLLEDWLRIIPRKQMLFIRFDDYSRNRTEELRKVFDFLELDTSVQMLRNITSTAAIKNKGPNRRKLGDMLPATKRLLYRFYTPFILRFASMVGDKKYLWADTGIENQQKRVR